MPRRGEKAGSVGGAGSNKPHAAGTGACSVCSARAGAKQWQNAIEVNKGSAQWYGVKVCAGARG